MSETLKQMSIRAIGGDGKDAIRQNRNVFMGRIGGEIQDVKTKEKRNGDLYSYLLGTFSGVNAAGVEYDSDVLFLPGFLHEKLEAELKANDGHAVQFCYDIFSSPNVKSSVGYAYVAKTVMKSEATDRMAELKQKWADVPLPTVEAEAPEAKPVKKGGK